MRKLLLLIAVLFTTLVNAQTITVTSPNGGEVWAGCTVHNITWTHSGTSGFFSVDYSTNGGTTWTSLATNLAASSYSWTVPNTSSNNCIVRVFDFTAPSTVDQSNAAFTITAPLILTAPNGGESWQVGGPTRNITWVASGTGTNLTLEYSINAGSSWTTITTTAVASSGSYTWTIPNTPSTQCLVRIRDVATPCMTDESNNLFTIAPGTPTITVTAPNTALTYYVAQTYNITWTSQYLVSPNVAIEYSTNNGTSWTTIVSSVANSGTYAWLVPNTPSTQCLVRVSEFGNPTANDISNVNFTISLPVITVTSPNTAVTWYVGSTNTISWSAAGGSGLYNVEYTIDNGATWTSLATNLAATSYSWVVPNTPSTQCLVRVTDATYPTSNDVSNVNFTISQATITVTSPNGGENWQGCSSQNITWTRAGTTNNAKIEYSTDGGTTWTTIVASYNAGTGTSCSYTWNPVNNTPSTNCFVRITDVSIPAATDMSNVPFTLIQNTAIIVNSPNGGENWQVGGPTQNITWAAAGTSTNLTIQYSIDNGTTWTTITTTANAASGTYAWTIPNTPSSLCKVKIFDAAYPTCKFDISDAVFTISAPTPVITVTSPNTAVTWYALQSYNINWTSAYLTSSFVKIEYSVDNGATWVTIIASVTNSGSYTWTVPNIPTTTQALVRVSEFGNPAVNDVSDVNFTISAPRITVSAPNTAVTWYVGTSYNITWSNTTLTSTNVKLEYSIDNGATWLTINNSYANSGAYAWTVPNTPSTQCLVKVSDVGTPTTFDVSNVNFTIALPTVTVTSPNGGENWLGCSSQTITWTRVGTLGTSKIEYSLDGGTTWVTLNAAYNAGTGSTCSYTWAALPNTPSTNCVVRVTENTVGVSDVSNTPFTISQNTSIIINTPNGGEVWQVGGPTQNITWAAVGTSTNLTIQYSVDGGTTWTTITTTAVASSGTYAWTIPNNPSANCMIKIFDAAAPTCKFDVSDAVFTISAPTPVITVTSPNTAVTWYVGNSYNINWTYAYLTSSFVKIEYSTDNGATWTNVIASVANSGTYTWTSVPNTPSTQCLVRVSEFGNPAVNDVSNVNFTIASPFITVTSPNLGTENWQGCSTQNITWTRGGTTNNAKIEYSLNGGTTWTTLNASYNAGTGTSCTYSWAGLPNTPSTNCLVRVTDVSIPTATDVSNNPFTISANTAIIVTSPNGGESWQVGGPTQNITWAATGTSTNLTIQYSINNGTTWTTITTTAVASSGLYVWTIPNTPSTTCLIKIFDAASSTCKFDISDANFTIAPGTPTFAVTSPNTAVTWYALQSYNITWTSQYIVNPNVMLEYSTDAGATWTTIVSSVANSGSYTWNVPNTPSTTCRVRVSEFGNPSANDISDVNFTISAPTITVTSPNTALTWYVGNTYSINWSNTTLSGPNVKIEYSTDGGTTWNTIIAATNNVNTYSWVVPNTPSTTCRVKVTDVANPAVFDISNVNFTIASPFITVTSPNGGENWQGCSSQTITWTRAGTTNNAKLEYSTDGGTTWTTIVASYNAGTGTSCSYTWSPVPNTASTNCYVRVTDVSIPTATDMSNVPFTIIQNTAIIVNTPNGGEVWQVGGPTQAITWAAAGTSTNLTIQYSTDNGTTWTTITTTAVASSGTYNWTIPNTPSTNCLVRIYDAASPTCKVDVSDAVFTIAAPTPVITVTSPNTAVTWYALQSYNITWTSAYLTSSFVKIEYSVDNGASWVTIVASVANSGSYTWSVPNIPTSTLALIRVSEFGNPTVNDVSNVNFTISAPVITVTAPNTAVTWYVATSYNIGWSSTTLTGSNVKIEYSTDNGTTWTTIVASVANSGTYAWTVPNTPSTQCLVKVSDATTPTTFDISNVNFTIAIPTITVTSPNGGENWQGCSSQTITWTRVGTVANARIEYSLNGGTTWTTIVASYNAGTGTSCSYTWTTVPNTPSTNCLVRVTDVNVAASTDMSNAPFTIIQNTAIIVNTPNGGEVWQVGGPTQNITWAAVGTSTTLTIQYSIDNGATWTNITTAATASAGTYAWTIPNTPSTQCLIKIFDAASPTCKFDVSDAVFTISPPTPIITVTSPNTALTRYVGSTYSITWTSAYLTSSFVKIEYSIDNGGSWMTITSATNNTGSYSWTVPNTPSSQCLVRISEFGNPAVSDISNTNFFISPAVIVTAPDGGENLGSCTTTSINWTAGGCSGNYKLEYTINGGTTWTTIIASYAATTTGACSYTWTLPTTPSTNCLVRVTDVAAPAKTDVSDAAFTISPAITVTQPNFGGSYVVGSTLNITWTSSGVSNFYNIDYSTNGGSTWTSIVFNTNITSNSYAWTIPNTPSTNCLVRVTDNVNTCKKDQSDVVFTITTTAAAITVTAPNGAENWQTCSTQNITWNASGTSGSYNIDYSVNGGSSWTSIVTNYAAGGSSCSYAWTIPNTISSSALIRVTDASVGTRVDQSDAAFNMTGLGLVATGTTSICNGDAVALNATGTSTYSWLPTTGLSNANIANPMAAPTTTTTYTVTGTAGACSNTATVTITVNPVPTVSVSPSSTAVCAGASTSLMASGGVSYSWLPATGLSSTTAPTVTATPAASTTYTVTGTTNGCSATATAAITLNPIPSITTSGAGTICAGTSASLSANGATTYSWLPGTGLSNSMISNPTATPTITTTYTVSGTSLSCTGTATVPVTVTPIPNVTTSGNPSICLGASTTITASGATTYSWLPTTGLSNPNIANPVASPTTTTTYTVTGTLNGCSNTTTVIVTVNPIPTTVATGTATICAGASTPLNATGATTYAWLPATGLSNANIANPTATPSATTTYTVTGTSNGCSTTATATVTVTPIPVINVTGVTTICNGNSTALSASGATTYSWLPTTGLSDPGISNPIANPSATTTYTVTGATGSCSGTRTVTITVNPIPNVNASGTNTICAGASTSLGATGATTYAWLPATGLSNANIANPTATPSATTTYTVTGTAAGCTNTATATVTITPLPVISVTGTTGICAGGSTTLNASGGTTYSWLPATGLSATNIANPTASPTSTTTYTVSGTTGSCTGTTTVTVTVNSLPVINVTGTTTICAGASTTLTASGALTSYSWLPTTGLSNPAIANPVANPTTTTTYTVTGTSGGCSGTKVVTVTVNPSPATAATGTATICSGTSTPLNATGATTYAWLPTTGLSNANIANPTATPTATTTYTVTGTSAGCSATATVTITVNPTPVVSITGTNTICNGGSTTLTASGASTSYSWLPATGLSNANIANPVASPTTTTTYTVSGTSGTCTATSTITVTVNPVPTVGATGTATICAGASAPLNATGATTYAWLPTTGLSNANIANPTATPATTTTYTVTGTSTGCSATATVTITVNPTPTANAGSPVSICTGASTTLNASGGTTYSWLPATGLSDPNIANPVATPASTTTYTVTVGNGTCSSTAAVTVTINSLPSVSAGADVSLACGGTATLGASGGTTYTWLPTTGLSNANIANPVATPTATTTYTVTASNGGCSGTDEVTVTVNALVANAGPDVTICAGGSTTLSGAVGGPTGMYGWTGAQRFGGTTFDRAQGVAADASGNTYTTGYFNGTVSFGSFTLTSSSYDVFVTKSDPSGNVLWAVKAGSTGIDEGKEIAVDPSGNVYISGVFNGTVTFGTTTLTSSSIDVFLMKYNAAGTFQWAVKAGGTGIEDVRGIAVDATGAWLTGYFKGTATFGSTSLTATGGSTDSDMFVAKYNTAGTLSWAVKAGSNNPSLGDWGSGIGLDGSGNCYVSGNVSYTATFGSLTYTVTGGASDPYDPILAKYNSSGVCQWVRGGGTTTGTEYSEDVVTDASGNSYMVGHVIGAATFGSFTTPATGSDDAFIVKYNSAGVVQWATAIGGTATDEFTGVKINSSTGNIFAAGYSKSASLPVGSSTLTGFGSFYQSFIAAFSPAGAPLFGIKSDSPSPGGDQPEGLATDASGNMYIVGTFSTAGTSSTAVFGSTTLTGLGGGDGFVAKLGTTVSSPTYSWSPATGLSSTTTPYPVATPGSTTSYVLTITNGTCSAKDTVVVTVNPIPTASAGSPVSICSGSSTTLNATGGTTYSWLPATGLSATNIANPVASPTTTTTYTVTVSNGSSCTATATVTVTVNTTPTANAGSDVTITCGASTTLAASGGTTYSWLPTTGLSNANIASPVATPPYTITYTVTASNGTCSSTDAVTVTVGNLTADAGADVSICSGGSTTLNGSTTGSGVAPWVNLATSYNYTQSAGTYTAITGGTVWLNAASTSMDDVVSGAITIPTFKFNNVNYTSLYISTNGFITFGATAPTTTTYTPISSTETYGGAVSAFGVDLNKYAAGTPEIRYQQVGNEFVIQWKDMGRYTTGSAIDRLSFQIRLNTVTNQVNIVYAATSLQGNSTSYPEVGLRGANNTFTTNVKNRSVVSSTGAWLNSVAGTTNASTCYYNSSTPGTVPAAGTTFTWSLPSATTTYAWTPPTGLSSTTILNPVANPTTTTTYTLTVTSGSCTAVDQVTVTVASPASVSAGADVAICSGNSTVLNATGGGTYSWAPATGLSATNVSNPTATPTTTTTYTVTVSNGSCSFTDAVVVTVTPVPAQPSAIAGSSAICANSTNTYSVTPVSGATSYTWTLPGGWTGTSTTNSITATAGTTGGNIIVVANNACGTGTSQTLTVTITPAPAAPGAISGPATACAGAVSTYSITPVTFATSYTWTLPGGWTGTSTTTSINATAGATGGNITVVANGACGSSTAQTLAVGVNAAPAQPAAITGNNTVCSGTAETYSVAAVSGATSYTWTMPSGWTGTSTTNSITATTGTTSGNIIVTANNACGSSTAQILAVTSNSIPAQSAAITGNANICANSSNTYTATPVSGATSYTWTMPSGWTGSTASNVLSATATTTGGTITVTANNACGTGTAQTLAVNIITAPAMPAAISGNATACSGTSNTYSVTPVSGATSYTWTLPGGWTGTSTTNSITTTVGSAGGNITVTADNACGSSTAQTFAVTINNTPAQPAAISGTTTICSGTTQTYSVTLDPAATGYTWTMPAGWSGSSTSNTISTTAGTSSGTIIVTANNGCGSSTPQSVAVTVNSAPAQPSVIAGTSTVCPGSSAVYSVTNDPTASFYSWTLPGGWSGSSITNTITATATTTGGTISVTAHNSCGASTPQTVAITIGSAPAQPVAVLGSATVCSGSTNTYSVATDPNATNYVWTLPSGWAGTSTTNTISATADANGGTITVTPSNACGTGTAQTITVAVNAAPAQPAAITGTASTCEGTTQTFSVPVDPAATGYTWTLPADWTGTSTTETITATVGASTGVISVTADNACGSSTAQTISVTVDPLPAMPSVITGNSTVCAGSTQSYSIGAVAGATSYTWTMPSGWSGSSSTENISITPDTNPGTLTVYATNACGNGPAQQLNITVQTALATPVLVSADSVICDGTSVTYQVAADANVTSYTWTLPSSWTGASTTETLSAVANTNSGVVTVTGNNVCGTSTTLSINVTVNAIPSVSLTSFTPVCDNSTAFALTGGSPAGGTYSGTGVTGGTTFTPSAAGAGTFTITYTYADANSCSASDTASIQVDLCTGVAAADATGNVSVYPNPFSDYTTVHIGQSIQLKGTEIHIFDMLGKEVMILSDIHTYDVRIDRNDLRDGMYFYRLINDNKEISTGKLIIE